MRKAGAETMSQVQDMLRDRISLLEALRHASYEDREPKYTNKQLDAAITELKLALQEVGNHA